MKLAKDDKFGMFLADEQGKTLYLFTKDTKNTSNCYDKCEAAWPVLFTTGAPRAGDGVDAALLGTTTRKDGKTAGDLQRLAALLLGQGPEGGRHHRPGCGRRVVRGLAQG